MADDRAVLVARHDRRPASTAARTAGTADPKSPRTPGMFRSSSTRSVSGAASSAAAMLSKSCATAISAPGAAPSTASRKPADHQRVIVGDQNAHCSHPSPPSAVAAGRSVDLRQRVIATPSSQTKVEFSQSAATLRQSVDLAKRLDERDRRGDPDVERAQRRPDRNPERARRPPAATASGHARRFPADEQDVAGPEGEVPEPRFALGRQEREPAAGRPRARPRTSPTNRGARPTRRRGSPCPRGGTGCRRCGSRPAR